MLILRKITDQAVRTFSGSEGDFDAWVEHWFLTARTVREEFEAEGLSGSASEVTSIMSEQRAMLPNNKHNIEL